MIVQLTTGENGDVWELSQPVWCGVVHLTEAQTRLLRERIEQEYHVHLYDQYTYRLSTPVGWVDVFVNIVLHMQY